MLNVDVANKVGCDESSVIEFIEKVLKSNRGYHQSHILLNDKSHRNIVDDKIKDLRIHYSKPNGYKRNYRVNKMPPVLKYENVDEFRKVKYGKWQAGRRYDEISNVLKFLVPANLKYWGVLDLGDLSLKLKKQFVNRLLNECKMRGLPVDNPVYESAGIRNTSQVRETFKKLCHNIKRKKEDKIGKKMDVN